MKVFHYQIFIIVHHYHLIKLINVSSW